MPNPWDVGSARLLASTGFEALATTSAGFAWALGKHDQTVTRDELVAHVTELAAATDLPLNVDSERCYPDDPGGVAETVALLAEAGAAGFSIEDYDPARGRHGRGRRRRRACRRRGRGVTRAVRADGAHRPGREPHPRRRPTSTTRSPAWSRIATPAPTCSTRRGSPTSSRSPPSSSAVRDPAERPRAAGRPDGRRAGRRGRPPGLDGEPAGRRVAYGALVEAANALPRRRDRRRRPTTSFRVRRSAPPSTRARPASG